jgi:PBP1b-binding outer membrane lipoprotein LpoB
MMSSYNKFSKRALVVFIVVFLIGLSGCSVPRPNSQVTNRRAVTAELPNAILDQITVEDLRVTADLMARDLIMQPFLYNQKSPAIVSVKPIENKTDLTIDPDIFQKTIRVKLMEKSGGRILFRDDASHQYTIDERLQQSGKVQVSTTTTRRRTTNPFQLGQPMQVQEQGQSDTTMTEEGEVSKRVADVNYFLTGLVYSSTEVDRVGAARGMRYFQFQFRLTDAQTNIIMWEKEYAVKRQARFK